MIPNALTNFNKSNLTVKCYKVNSVNVNYIITVNKNVKVEFLWILHSYIFKINHLP